MRTKVSATVILHSRPHDQGSLDKFIFDTFSLLVCSAKIDKFSLARFVKKLAWPSFEAVIVFVRMIVMENFTNIHAH